MSRLNRVVLTCAVAAAAVALPAAAANSTTFSGRAKVVDGKVLGVPITLVDTGPLAAEGGALDEKLLCYPGAGCAIDVPDLTNGALGVEVLHASTVAHGNKSRADATVAEVGVAAAGQTVNATFIRASAEASCTSGLASVRGSAELVNLVVNNAPVLVTGEVSQRVDLPGGGLVLINEQVASVAANKGEITVNALHIVLPALPLVPGTETDLVIAQAHADIVCATPPPPPRCDSSKDFVTGGGWIEPSGRANFAVAGGIKNGSFWGHLNYIDHGAGMKVKGTGVTGYLASGPTRRVVTGTAEIDGKPGYTYRAEIADNGEPGRGADTFTLNLSNGYTATGPTLAGGNIQLHGPCQ
jgi:hypothetical protein